VFTWLSLDLFFFLTDKKLFLFDIKKNFELNFMKYTILRIVGSNIFISAIIKFLIEEKTY